jgi:hypothetical protein
MTTYDDIRRICAKLPGSVEGVDRFGFSVENKGKWKGFAWTWAERIHPKKARVINERVLAVIVPNLSAKEVILGSGTEKFFTEPHYNGYPAVLVRLDCVAPEEIEDLLVDAWRCKAPPEAVKLFDSR